jgi:TonB family protein
MWMANQGSVVAPRIGACAVASIVALGMVGAAASAQTPRDDSLTVRGAVQMVDGTAISGARLRLLQVGLAPAGGSVIATSDDGQFRLVGLTRGTHQLEVRRLGFKPETLSVEVPAVDGGRMIVPLMPLAVSLAPVTVRAAATSVLTGPFREFNARRARGFGNFITRHDIEQRHPYRVTDLFRSIPNMEIERDGGRSAVRMRGRRCDPLVWVDRVPLVGGFPDLDAMSPKSLEGVEIYSGVATVPPDLMGPRDAGGCGVIVIWTRHGERPVPAGVAAVDFTEALERAEVFTADQVDSMAAPAGESLMAFGYPESLVSEKKEGQVLAEFVVDTIGQIRGHTVNIVATTDPAFGETVRQTLLATRFSPAVRRGRLVQQVVYLPVHFAPEGAQTSGQPRSKPD